MDKSVFTGVGWVVKDDVFSGGERCVCDGGSDACFVWAVGDACVECASLELCSDATVAARTRQSKILRVQFTGGGSIRTKGL